MSTASNLNPFGHNLQSLTETHHLGSSQMEPLKNGQLELRFGEEVSSNQKCYKRSRRPRPLTSPSLFADGKTDRMASALVIWGASDILTQKQNLTWALDSEGKLCLVRSAINNKGEIHYWVTDINDLSNEHPATLAGAAALAVIETFDIRAACMHLIYAAHATKLTRPWEQEFTIDDRQIEEYLGLNKRKHQTKTEKLALIEKLASQPCQISTFISWPAQGKLQGFTVSETRLWHMLEIQRHYQGNLFGSKELVGLTFRVKAGHWAKYFLNGTGAKDKQAYYQCGTLSKDLLQRVIRIWQHNPGAARLLVWLLFKTKFEQRYPVTGQTLMEAAYGSERVQQARKGENKKLRAKLAERFETDLLTITENNWVLYFDSETYPPEIQPYWAGRGNGSRPKGYFERILTGRVWIMAPDELRSHSPHRQKRSLFQVAQSKRQLSQNQLTAKIADEIELTGSQVKAIRTAKGWTTRQLSECSGISQSMISMIETGQRSISRVNLERLRAAFELSG